jgi:hypothetical protein
VWGSLIWDVVLEQVNEDSRKPHNFFCLGRYSDFSFEVCLAAFGNGTAPKTCEIQ